MMFEEIKNSYEDALSLMQIVCNDESVLKETVEVARAIARCFQNGNKVLIFGNGGSCTDAMHFAEELTGRYRQHRKALAAISLSDPAHLTCVANDYGFEYIFERGISAYGKAGDFAIGLSTSGNSENIIKAIDLAKDKQLITMAMLGKDGGKLKGIADHEFIIGGETSDRIQEIHMMILHIIIEGIERTLFQKLYKE